MDLTTTGARRAALAAALLVAGCSDEVELLLVPKAGDVCGCATDTDLSCVTSVSLELADADGGVIATECVAVPPGERSIGAPGLGGRFAAARPAAAVTAVVTAYRGAGDCRGAPIFTAKGPIEGRTLTVECLGACQKPACTRRWCLGPAARVTGLGEPALPVLGGVVTAEGQARRIYVLVVGAGLASARLLGPTTADPASLTPLAASPPTAVGYTLAPRVRADGRELVFPSTEPSSVWWQSRAFLATRTATGWSRALPLDGLDRREGEPAYVHRAVLLPDDRTMIAVLGGACGPVGCPSRRLAGARRPNDEAGDRRFAWIPTEVDADVAGGHEIIGLALSCDGWHLLYTRLTGELEPWVAEIRSLDPLRIGGARRLDGVVAAPRATADYVWELAEAPGCEGIYHSSETTVSYQPATACP